ncbi:allatostatin-A receptor-like [Patiria miniata]|uniref:G-protein coupled receptors family 1 profile domain-containing protein n=1 Tax=Patiria miniata TaxID=46514 RepID=A0A913ZVX2_PATMI|nr:allatostatin-A receptor-like [Patiria miniata]
MDSALLLRVINTTTGILGILGNGLVCLVIVLERSMHTYTNALILHQATIDFLASIFIIGYEYIPRTSQVGETPAGYLLCYLWNSRYFMFTFFVASTYSLVTVTFERFFAIVYPYRYQRYFDGRKAIAVCIACIWAIVLTFRIYAFFQWSVDDGGKCGSRSVGGVLAVVLFLLQYVIPLSLMTYMYIRIGIEISRSANRIIPTVSESDPQHNNNNARRLLRARRNTLKTLVIVFITFVLCWSLNQVLFFMHNMGWQPLDFTSTIYITSTALLASNASVNPFIYAFKYKTFQQALRRLLYRVTGRQDRLNNVTDDIPITGQID